MRRTTTAEHTLTFPLSLDTVNDMQITYSQGEQIVLVKDMEEVTVDDKKATVTLSEEDTKLFEAEKPVELQVKLATNDGKIIASKIMRIPVTRILNEELMEAE